MTAVAFLACLIVLANCQNYHYINGNMTFNNQPSDSLTGTIRNTELLSIKLTSISGLYIHGKTKIPLLLDALIDQINATYIHANCGEAIWGRSTLTLKGSVTAHISGKDITYSVNCQSKEGSDAFVINAKGVQTDNLMYTPPEAAVRAIDLIGEKAEMYVLPVRIINYATLGCPYNGAANTCSWYISHLKTTAEAKPGYVIVGKNGEHCAIINKEAKKFIHLNPVTNVVDELDMSMLKAFFRNGYVYLKY